MSRILFMARVHRVLVGSLFVLVFGSVVQAQQRVGRAAPKRTDSGRKVNPPGASSGVALIEPTAPVANFFSRATEAAFRRDWKLTIDSLQRIIEDPENVLYPRGAVSSDGQRLYETARRLATRQLAGLDPDGLTAYRLLFDGAAGRLIDQARQGGDSAKLRQVMDRYALTRFGDDAADMLSSWLLDEGSPEEAMAIIEDYLPFATDADVPAWRWKAKLLAARALLGQLDGSDERIATLAHEDGPGSEEQPWVQSIPAVVQPMSLSQARRVDEWPTIGGGPSRRGLMPQVAPWTVQPAAWSFRKIGLGALPRTDGSFDGEIDDGSADRPEFVVSGTDVLVRTRRGVLALHRESLSLHWEAPDADDLQMAVARRIPRTQSFGGAATQVGAESVADGRISVLDDLVLTLERSGTDWTIRQPAALPLLFRGNNLFGNDKSGDRLLLVARDVSSGDVRWVAGNSGSPTDPLRDAEFLDVPVGFGRHLGVAYRQRADLYLGLLNPDDGSLVKAILLCSYLDMNRIPRLGVALASSSGRVFVSSGANVVFALSERDLNALWASQYAPGEGHDEHRPRTRPPSLMVAGGLFLIIPTELDEILAFDVRDGAIRWRRPVPDDAYLVASDGGSVWIGGSGVSRLDARSGETLWSHARPSDDAGRIALCGRELFIPSRAGLHVWNADQGRTLTDDPRKVSGDPLGVILCLDDALWSVDASGVRRFPDVDRLEERLNNKLAERPSDQALQVLQARILLLRGHPEEALSSLSVEPIHDRKGDDGLSQEWARTRVDALMALAANAESDHDRVLQLLSEAFHASRTDEDRWRTGIEYADALMEARRGWEGAAFLWQLAVQSKLEQRLVSSNGVEVDAGIDLAMRLQSLLDRLDVADRQKFDDWVTQETDEACAALAGSPEDRAAFSRLRAVAEVSVSRNAVRGAWLALADWYINHDELEKAEDSLLIQARRAGLESDDLLTLTRMATLYAHPVLRPTRRWEVALAALREHYGQDPLTERELGRNKLVDGLSGGEPLKSVAMLAVQLERRGADVGAEEESPAVAPPASASALSAAPAWSVSPPPSPFGVVNSMVATMPLLASTGTGPRSRDSFNGVILFDEWRDSVSAISLTKGEVLWSADLDVPERFQDDASGVLIRQGDAAPGRLFSQEGQIAVFCGSNALFGIGSVTGRRLWAVPYDHFLPIPSDGDVRWRDRATSAGGGMVVSTPHQGRLSAIRLLDGSLAWERDLEGELLESVDIRGDWVLTVDRRRELARTLRRADGRLLAEVRFRQPDVGGRRVSVIATGHHWIGPQRVEDSDYVVSYDVETGEESWRIAMERPLAALFTPSDGYVGVGLVGGEVLLINAESGEILFDRSTSVAFPVVSGLLHDGLFVLEQSSIRQNQPYPVLRTLDLATGAEVWSRTDLQSVVRNGESLRLQHGLLVAVMDLPSTGGGRSPGPALTVIDPRTGRGVGEIAPISGADPRARFGGAMVVNDEVVVVRTQGAVYGFPFIAVPESPGGGS